jgi:hypothetical protein
MFELKLVQDFIDAGEGAAAGIMTAHNEAMKNFCDWLKTNMDVSKSATDMLTEYQSQ